MISIDRIYSVHLSAFPSVAKEKLRSNYIYVSIQVENSNPKVAEASKHLNAAHFLSVMIRNETVTWMTQAELF